MKKQLETESLHTLPADMREGLRAKPKAMAAWKDIMPLARNEWICWVISVKKPETRAHHLKRFLNELPGGKRRPCCFAGCIHRKRS